jgi:methylenetetrahydrofolate reductase (NADPH)
MDRLVEARTTWKFSVIVSLAPLPSADTARWVKEQMPDSKIPEALIKRLEQAPDPELEGIRICAEAMQEVAEIPGITGVHLMSTGSPEHISAAIDASRLASKAG